MKYITVLLIFLSLTFITTQVIAKTDYKNSDGYQYLKNKQNDATEYRKNLPVEEKVDVSDDITQINSLRADLRKEYKDVYELKTTSKRYLNRKKSEFDEFEPEIYGLKSTQDTNSKNNNTDEK